MMPIQPRISTPSSYSPTYPIQSTEEESRYFQYFCEQTAYELSGYFENSFWTQTIIQESHSIAPIRHAVIAIAALYKGLEAPLTGTELKVNILQQIDKKHEEFAFLQHLKAIQALNQYISTSGEGAQLRTALITCLLFVCFETFQGSYLSSVQQTYSGLRLLRSYYAGQSQPRRTSRPISKAVFDEVLAAIHNRSGDDKATQSTIIATHIQEYLGYDDDQPQTSPTPAKSIMATDNLDLGDSPRLEQGVIPSHYRSNFRIEQQPSLVEPSMLDSPNTSARCEYIGGLSSELELPNQSYSENLRMLSPQLSTWSQPPRRPSSTKPNSSASTPMYASSLSGHDMPSPFANSTFVSQGPSDPPSRRRSAELQNPPSPRNDAILDEAIIQAFARIDSPGLFFGLPPGIPPLIWDLQANHHIPIPYAFADLSAAQHCWDFLMDRALQFYRRTLFNRKYPSMKSDSPTEIEQKYSSYISQLNAFERAFKPILDSSISNTGEIIDPAAVVISIHVKTTAITLSAVSSFSEMVYDAFLPSFRYIVRNCALLINSYTTTHLPRNSRFSFDVGIVPPLHVVAMKCREPKLRRAALNLLLDNPRQEGMWDSVLSGRTGRWLINCEEEGLELPPGIGPTPSGEAQVATRQYPRSQEIGSPWQTTEYHGGMATTETSSGSYIFGQSSRSSGARSTRSSPPTYRGTSMSPVEREHMEQQSNVWMVPESNRMQLLVVDMNIPDRYMTVKCQRALMSEDGTREERETVIAW